MRKSIQCGGKIAGENRDFMEFTIEFPKPKIAQFMLSSPRYHLYVFIGPFGQINSTNGLLRSRSWYSKLQAFRVNATNGISETINFFTPSRVAH